MVERGQTFTVEALLAAILIIATVGFALQAVAITANTASGGDTELRSQQAGLVGGVLDTAISNGDLERTLLAWNTSEQQFHDADPEDGYFIASPPNTSFGAALDDALNESYIRYTINLRYQTPEGETAVQPLVESGSPNDDGIRMTRTVTLYDDHTLVDENESSTSMTLEAVEEDFYAPNVAPDGPVYNVLEVEVILWQG